MSDKILENFNLKQYQKQAEYKVESLLKVADELEVMDSLDNYLKNNEKPDFWKWFNSWRSYKTNHKDYKDKRCVYIMNAVLESMSSRLQWYFGNKSGEMQDIQNYQKMNDKLEFFTISRSGYVDLKIGYLQQFYDVLLEKMQENIKPELYKIVNGIGIENIIYVYVSDFYYELENWKKSVSDCLDYKLNEIIESVLATRLLRMDYVSNKIKELFR